MIGVAEFRQLLSPAACNLSDKEIEHIRDLEYGFADAIFEMWLRDRHTQSLKENVKTIKT
jgi:hypothetical protein